MARDRAIDKATRLQALKRPCRRRAIERDICGQGCLIGGSMFREGGKKAVLQRRDLEGRAFFLEQGDVDLMQPPDQVTRPLLERPRAFGFRRASSGHQIAPGARAALRRPA
jgi:hypothetical protein